MEKEIENINDKIKNLDKFSENGLNTKINTENELIEKEYKIK